jgi:hypothetical protein
MSKPKKKNKSKNSTPSVENTPSAAEQQADADRLQKEYWDGEAKRMSRMSGKSDEQRMWEYYNEK